MASVTPAGNPDGRPSITVDLFGGAASGEWESKILESPGALPTVGQDKSVSLFGGQSLVRIPTSENFTVRISLGLSRSSDKDKENDLYYETETDLTNFNFSVGFTIYWGTDK